VGGVYLGLATIAAAYWWYLFDAKGPHLKFSQVITWTRQPQELQQYFENDTPSTMAMSVLVVVEMFSALTAVSERQSIFVVPPWKNWYLCGAVCLSLIVHLITLEIPLTKKIFSVVSLDWEHWLVIFIIGVPVLLIEELFKVYIRAHTKHVEE
jgi:Ca2+ transporting ATPase